MEKAQNSTIAIYASNHQTNLNLPFIEGGISAGFPSPALDFMDVSIDLNQYIIKHPSATFYGRVKGNSLQNAGITDGDLLVIDKSLEPTHGKIAVCYLDGEFTAKRIKKTSTELWLTPENDAYQAIQITPENELIIWGVVTHVIKSV